MIERGELPQIKGLVDQGFRSDLVAYPPLSSPVIWTTFATGRLPRVHNILDHTFPYQPGPKLKIRSTLRRAPAIWNIASHYSRSISVVSYFATHPPEKIRGTMISDRAAEGVAGSFYPAELETELREVVDRLKDPAEARAVIRSYLPWDYDKSVLQDPTDPLYTATVTAKGRLTTRALFEDFTKRAALKIADRQDDLLMVYLRMPDHASHATWLYYDDSDFEEPPKPYDREMLRGVIPESYRQVDTFVGELREVVGTNVNLILVSDHGFGSATGHWTIGRSNLNHLTGNHRPDGIFLGAGPDITKGHLTKVTAMDIAPTLLALSGLPVSEKMPGRIIQEMFEPEYLTAHPIQTVEEYRIRWEPSDPAPEVSPNEREALESLTALGYLGSDTPVAESTAGGDIDFWSAEEKVRRSTLIGEGLYYYSTGDLTRLERLLRETEENDPRFSRALPRLIRNHLNQWESAIGYSLVDDTSRAAFEAAYPGRIFNREPSTGSSLQP